MCQWVYGPEYKTLGTPPPYKIIDFKNIERSLGSHLFEREDGASYTYGGLRCVWCYGSMLFMMFYGYGTRKCLCPKRYLGNKISLMCYVRQEGVLHLQSFSRIDVSVALIECFCSF